MYIVKFIIAVMVALISALPWLILFFGKLATGLNKINFNGNTASFETLNGFYIPYWLLVISIATEILALTYLFYNSLVIVAIVGTVLIGFFLTSHLTATKLPS